MALRSDTASSARIAEAQEILTHFYTGDGLERQSGLFEQLLQSLQVTVQLAFADIDTLTQSALAASVQINSHPGHLVGLGTCLGRSTDWLPRLPLRLGDSDLEGTIDWSRGSSEGA